MSNSLNTLNSVSVLLTENVLQQVVNKIYLANRMPIPTVLKYEVRNASNKGEGYLGITYRLVFHLSDKTNLFLIAKAMPSNIVRRKTFQCDVFFALEVYFYNSVVPTFQEFELKQRGIIACKEDSLLNIPECYHAFSDGVNDFLLLEDLCVKGYDLAERSEALDINHMKSLLQVVARLHAFSYAMKYLSHDTFRTITSTMKEPAFNTENEFRLTTYMHNLGLLMYNAVKDTLQGTIYLTKFENFINKNAFYKNILNSLELREPAVIGHGDCWINNYMFKDNGLLSKAIDFQIIRYGSPVLDISMFMFSCMTEEQLAKIGGTHVLLEIYHQELLSNVEALGAPVSSAITWEQLCLHWKKSGVFGLACAIELVPLSLVQNDEVQDLDRVEGNEAIPLENLTQFNEITSQEGKKRLAGLITLAVNEGML